MSASPQTRSDTVVLATRNKGKIAELRALLAGLGPQVVGLAEFPDIGEIPETGTTFLENARSKARAVCQATGLVSLADDSGLCVDALDGAPGCTRPLQRRKRHRRRQQRQAPGRPGRRARGEAHLPVRVRVVAVAPDGRELAAEGLWEGRVTTSPAARAASAMIRSFSIPPPASPPPNSPPKPRTPAATGGKALANMVKGWA
jgi:XTP/dITP diphosphohydrolase